MTVCVAVARSVVVAGTALGIGGSSAAIALGYADSWWLGGGPVMIELTLFFSVFVWLVVPHRPDDALVWTMAVIACLSGAGYAGAAVISGEPGLALAGAFVPADVPTVAALLVMLAVAAVYVALYLWLTFGLLLFADGRLPTQTRGAWLPSPRSACR